MLSVHDFAEFIKNTQNSCVIICDQDLLMMQQALKVLDTGKTVLVYPSVGQFPYDPAPPSALHALIRLKTLQKLKKDDHPYCLLISPLAWLEKRPVLEDLSLQSLVIKKGDTQSHTHLIDILSARSYIRTDIVEYPGQYAVRGDRIDIFIPHMSYPVRLDFFGDTIEEIKRFDITSQRSSSQGLLHIDILPAAEFILTQKHIAYYQEKYAAQLTPIDQQMIESIALGSTTKNLGHLWPLFYQVSHHISDFWQNQPIIFCEPMINLRKQWEEIQEIYRRNLEQGRFVLAPDFLYEPKF